MELIGLHVIVVFDMLFMGTVRNYVSKLGLLSWSAKFLLRVPMYMVKNRQKYALLNLRTGTTPYRVKPEFPLKV